MSATDEVHIYNRHDKKRKNVFFLLLKSYLLQVNNVYSTFKKKKKAKIYF